MREFFTDCIYTLDDETLLVLDDDTLAVLEDEFLDFYVPDDNDEGADYMHTPRNDTNPLPNSCLDLFDNIIMPHLHLPAFPSPYPTSMP